MQALVWIAIFAGVWHVAYALQYLIQGANMGVLLMLLIDVCSWGTTVTSLLQASRLTSADGQTSVMGAHVWIPPWMINTFFLVVLFTAVGVMSGTSGGETTDWNRGAGAWSVLHDSLLVAYRANSGATGDANSVLARIPQADRWLNTMAHAFWRFQMTWIVCLTFSVSWLCITAKFPPLTA